MDSLRLTRYDPALDVELGSRAYGTLLVESELQPRNLALLVVMRAYRARELAYDRLVSE